MISALRLLLSTLTMAAAGPVLSQGRAHTVGGRPQALHVISAGLAVRPGSKLMPSVEAAGRSRGTGDDLDEADPHRSVGHFLAALRKAIPWAAGLALVVALAVVVATCWLRKGVLLQDLVTRRGRIGTGKHRDTRKAAARYLEQREKRQATGRDEEAESGTDSKANGERRG